MTEYDILSDDYVASLLVDEAKHGASGSGAFPAEKREAERPKEPQPRRRESSHKHRDPELRKRQMSDIQAILGGPSKRRDRDDGRRSGRSDRDRGKSEKRRRDGESSKQDNDLLQAYIKKGRREKVSAVTTGRRRVKRGTCSSAQEIAARQVKLSKEAQITLTGAYKETPRAIKTRLSVSRRGGRGTIGGAADLDRRFSESYDPKLDVEPESDGGGGGGGDWDDAVEAFRDRVKLKMNQEKRMRDAGFAEDQIRRITQGGEKTEKDVVWTKAGEKRAWDQGKEVDGGGDAEMEVPPTLFSEDY
ncbi:hypothetical protein O9K51_02341 [Purpureocillium lavendulum]|uniref:Pre-mRNA-splicing factor 38B n=1 Tax=Purpureocillium lavendulum TaxID=1247861 RepID=A0AB34FX95_9HYPO|nr:hypothetical protein O9K51_02341 [Purpureocillium lavendulum]